MEVKSEYLVGYRLVPVMSGEFKGMQVASSSSCPVTNICLSGSGGRKDVLSEQAKNLILNDKFSQSLLRLRAHEIGVQNLKDKEHDQ